MSKPVRLHIDSLAFGGDGVGRHDGKAIFVPGTTPGDIVDVRLASSNRRFARGELLELIEAGPGRIDAPCPVYPACGGCQWQHIDYATQFAAKAAIVRRALAPFGTPQFHEHPAPAVNGYRRRARLHTAHDGRLLTGFHGRHSDRIIDTATCLQLEPSLAKVLEPLRSTLLAAGPLRGEIELLAGRDGNVHAAICNRQPVPDWRGHPSLTESRWCAGLMLVDRDTTTVSGQATLTLDARGVQAHARAFTQANAAQDAVLRRQVLAHIGANGAADVLEFHAGIGNFTVDLLAAGLSVTAVESNPDAVALLRRNAAAAAAHCADAETFTWTGKPGCILLDPPREGAPALSRRIAASKARQVLYVSCDPMTLARDLAVLTGAGLRLRQVDIIDMMPQTYHIETACFLSAK